MKRRKKREFNNIEIWTDVGDHCPSLIAKFTFVKKTPIDYSLERFSTMPFKLIDKIWEKYGIARVYDGTVSTKIPIVECWYPPNVIRCSSPAEFEKVCGALFGYLTHKQRFGKEPNEMIC